MNKEATVRPIQQQGTDANRDPISGTPVGTGALVAGPEARALAAEMDPAVEDAYWKSNYSKQTYVDRNSPDTTYQLAYRTGYEGRRQYPGKKFAEVETNLQRDYDKSKGNSTLTWDRARNAARDAWNRVELALPGMRTGTDDKHLRIHDFE